MLRHRRHQPIQSVAVVSGSSRKVSAGSRPSKRSAVNSVHVVARNPHVAPQLELDSFSGRLAALPTRAATLSKSKEVPVSFRHRVSAVNPTLIDSSVSQLAVGSRPSKRSAVNSVHVVARNPHVAPQLELDSFSGRLAALPTRAATLSTSKEVPVSFRHRVSAVNPTLIDSSVSQLAVGSRPSKRSAVNSVHVVARNPHVAPQPELDSFSGRLAALPTRAATLSTSKEVPVSFRHRVSAVNPTLIDSSVSQLAVGSRPSKRSAVNSVLVVARNPHVAPQPELDSFSGRLAALPTRAATLSTSKEVPVSFRHRVSAVNPTLIDSSVSQLAVGSRPSKRSAVNSVLVVARNPHVAPQPELDSFSGRLAALPTRAATLSKSKEVPVSFRHRVLAVNPTLIDSSVSQLAVNSSPRNLSSGSSYHFPVSLAPRNKVSKMSERFAVESSSVDDEDSDGDHAIESEYEFVCHNESTDGDKIDGEYKKRLSKRHVARLQVVQRALQQGINFFGNGARELPRENSQLPDRRKQRSLKRLQNSPY